MKFETPTLLFRRSLTMSTISLMASVLFGAWMVLTSIWSMVAPLSGSIWRHA